MITVKTFRLSRRIASTAAVVAVAAVLVVIYLRSEGNGNGALAPVQRASESRSAGGEHGATSKGTAGGTDGSGGTGSGSCEAPRVCGSPPSASSTSGGSPTTGTYTGPVAETPYGPVQVAVAEQGGKIVDVKALQLPTEHVLSREISEQVAPMLRSEALQAQSAEINVVSGATFTSQAFATSLQAALQQVG